MTPPRARKKIHHCIAAALSPLWRAFQDFKSHPDLAELYPEYLFLSHAIVRASVPLMQDALTQTEKLSTRDPLTAQLEMYFAKHIPEEIDHDLWLLEDFEELGLDRTALLRRLPPPTVAALVGAQYYWIRHYHPVALLGYIAVLEGYPPRIEDINQMIERSGLPKSAFRTLAHHAGLDPSHSRDLDTFFDTIPLSQDQLASICSNSVTTVRLLSAAFADLLDPNKNQDILPLLRTEARLPGWALSS
ncbi:MAG: iron-containing redox enzyme family protein [Egibacteraceae bacterium]